MWFNWYHLVDASEKANIKYNWITAYWWHFYMSFKEFVFLFTMAIGSLIHAIFPFLLDFKLLEWRIKRLEELKKQLPKEDLLNNI